MQVKQYFGSAIRDLEIAQKIDIPEVRFKFSYDALIKFGIATIAKAGYKVRSQPGHHVKIIEKLSELLKDEDIAVVGNHLRQQRNKDFYKGGSVVTEKEAQEYLEFVRKVFNQSR